MASAEYRVGPGDVLELAVAQEPKEDPIKQLKLTEAQVKSFISAQPDLATVAPKLQEAGDNIEPTLQTELDTIAKTHGFASFQELDDVAANISIVMAAASTLVVSLSTGFATDRPPNVIVIFCDDMGYADIGPFGSNVATPNLDRMADEGRKFTDFYAAQAVCSASRCGIGEDCSEAQAPSWLSRGRVAKYASASAALTASAAPWMRTCRSSGAQ